MVLALPVFLFETGGRRGVTTTTIGWWQHGARAPAPRWQARPRSRAARWAGGRGVERGGSHARRGAAPRTRPRVERGGAPLQNGLTFTPTGVATIHGRPVDLPRTQEARPVAAAWS